jgi:hypothetical protein
LPGRQNSKARIKKVMIFFIITVSIELFEKLLRLTIIHAGINFIV